MLNYLFSLQTILSDLYGYNAITGTLSYCQNTYWSTLDNNYIPQLIMSSSNNNAAAFSSTISIINQLGQPIVGYKIQVDGSGHTRQQVRNAFNYIVANTTYNPKTTYIFLDLISFYNPTQYSTLSNLAVLGEACDELVRAISDQIYKIANNTSPRMLYFSYLVGLYMSRYFWENFFGDSNQYKIYKLWWVAADNNPTNSAYNFISFGSWSYADVIHKMYSSGSLTMNAQIEQCGCCSCWWQTVCSGTISYSQSV